MLAMTNKYQDDPTKLALFDTDVGATADVWLVLMMLFKMKTMVVIKLTAITATDLLEWCQQRKLEGFAAWENCGWSA